MMPEITLFMVRTNLLLFLLCHSFSTSLLNGIVEDVMLENAAEKHLKSQDGYYLDTLNEVSSGEGTETLQCPSDNVIVTNYKCPMNGKWVDCERKHCCKDYTYVAGRCISKEQDVCSMNLCEQACTVYLQRVICTCFDGYKFSPENQRKHIKPLCVDVDECLDGNGDCEHECINEIGSYRCACKSGYKLRMDNRTCELELNNITTSNAGDDINQTAAAHMKRCYASCESLVRLHEKLKILQEKVSALNTAIRLSSFASGPPGPAGPPGPQGPPGPRGFPGPESAGSEPQSQNIVNSNPDYTYSMLDAFVPLPGDDNAQCRCKRGAQGHPGPAGSQGPKGEQGERGPRGPKGDRGSLDFVLLLLADMRHDIVHMQNRVYINGETPPKLDLDALMKKKNTKFRQRLERQERLLHGYANPTMETTIITETTPATTEQTTLSGNNIEEFRDFSIPANNIDEIEYYVGSGEFIDEDDF